MYILPHNITSVDELDSQELIAEVENNSPGRIDGLIDVDEVRALDGAARRVSNAAEIAYTRGGLPTFDGRVGARRELYQEFSAQMGEISESFETIDQDSDGFIEARELEQFLKE